MFKYLFKIYKLRQLVKMRNQYINEYHRWSRVMSGMMRDGIDSSEAHKQTCYYLEDWRKLDNQIKLYE